MKTQICRSADAFAGLEGGKVGEQSPASVKLCCERNVVAWPELEGKINTWETWLLPQLYLKRSINAFWDMQEEVGGQ